MLWCGCIMALMAMALVISPERPSRDVDWEVWKTTYRKEYNSLEEEALRRAVWEKNMLMIEAHNLEYERGMTSYQLGMNHLGDMTAKEVTEKMTGLEVPPTIETNDTFTLKDFQGKLPKSIDYRTLGFVTPVRNQGDCNSCWAFSAVGALEGQLRKTTGKLVPLSPQNLVDCVSNNKGCQGGSMAHAFEYVKTNGISSEKTYPYVGKDQKCVYNESDIVAKIRRFKALPQGNERALHAVVAMRGPVSVGIDTTLETFIFYKCGVYYDSRCRRDQPNHALLVVGYGVSCGCQKFWIVKNSWGQDWGEGGYILMARNRRNLCGIASMASIPIM